MAENQTALTVWVHPVGGNSTKVALFHATAAVPGGGGRPEGTVVGTTLKALEVWTLSAVPQSNTGAISLKSDDILSRVPRLQEPPPSPGCRPAMGMKCGLAHWTPAFHTTPKCFEKGGAHDIAGALYHAPTKVWHLMAGCWSAGGWQHMTSKDLVNWEIVGKPRSFGGTGGLVHDDDGSIVAYAMDGGELHFWKATDEHATNWTESETAFKACCNDPIVWKDGGRWYAITAQHGATSSGGKNYGDETFFSSPHLIGPTSDWKPIPLFFMDKGSLLIPGHDMVHEFVSPDFFQNITGDPTNTLSVFMTSTYGPLADVWQNVSANTRYTYAMFFIGSQPGGAGTPFIPQRQEAVDWSPFSPHKATPGGLDVAIGWGPTQYGCCPKTVADSPPVSTNDGKPRRVLLGWLQNGCSSRTSIGISDGSENSLTLPRDLSLAPDGTMRQRYIPELQQLRHGPPTRITQRTKAIRQLLVFCRPSLTDCLRLQHDGLPSCWVSCCATGGCDSLPVV